MSNQIEYKVDADGAVDVEYYLNRGHELRAEYLSELSSELKAWFAGHLNLHWLKGSFARLAHH